MVHKSLSDGLAAALVRANDYLVQSGKTATPATSPFSITISREPGANGSSVGREVGRLLGWPVYDHELLDIVAKEMGAQVNMLSLIDEKPIGWLEQAVVDMVSEYKLNHDSYMVHLVATVKALGAHGKCVIVGRGANFVLPAATTVRVRLIGELPDRIATIRRLQNLSEHDAARWVDRTQHERVQFVKKAFGKDATDGHHYDLVLNSSRLPVSECAALVFTALGQMENRRATGRRSATA